MQTSGASLGGSPGLVVMWAETHVLKVGGSNHSNVNWMDIFSNIFVVKLYYLFEKIEIK